MSRLTKFKSSKSVAGILLIAVTALVTQAPTACASPNGSTGSMSREEATVYCDKHEPDLGIYCTDVYEAPTKERALSSLVSEYCSWIDRRSQTGWSAPFRIDNTVKGPVIVSVAFTESMAEMSKFYDRVRDKGLMPDSAPESFASALSEKNWWREGCWVIDN